MLDLIKDEVKKHEGALKLTKLNLTTVSLDLFLFLLLLYTYIYLFLLLLYTRLYEYNKFSDIILYSLF